MAHYAFIDDNNIVTEVITGRNETESVGGIYGEAAWEAHYTEFRPGMRCKRTSYNNNYRKNFAGKGYTYDEGRDAFIAPQTYPSWTLNEDTCRWEAPVPMPSDTTKDWMWDESVLNWVLNDLSPKNQGL